MGLKEDMIANVDALSDEDKKDKVKVHEALSTAIADHIDANVLLNGVYSGIIPPSTPSIYNGPHTFPVSSNFVHVNIPDAVTGSDPPTAQNAYSVALATEINKTLATGQNSAGTVNLGAPVGFTIVLTLTVTGTDRDTCFEQIADAVNSALSAGVIAPTVVPATGIDGSSGTVTFSTISVS